MNKKLILRLPPRISRGVYMQIILVMVMFWLRDVWHFPSAITYLTDVLTVWILMSRFNRIKSSISFARAKTQFKIVFVIMLCMLFGAVINFVNPLLTLWGARNNLRFFAFFFICVGVLDVHDVDSIIRLFKKFFLLNTLMCTYQYFVLGLSNDYLGGFFGTTQGSNAYVNVLLCMISAIVLAQYFIQKIKLHTLIVYLIQCLYIASLSELKVYYVEIIVLIVIAAIFARPSLKTVGICIAGILTVNVGIFFLKKYNPESLALFFDESARDFYLSGNGYTNSGDLNRFTAIQQLYSLFFKGNKLLSLFGFGLGSCEYASYSFLQSSFFLQYEYLHYRWFTHAWVYLEQGIVGIILLALFFISLIVNAIKNKKKSRNDLILMSLIFLPTCLFGIIYNSTLQLEACYFIAFMCAIPFVVSKSDNSRKYNIHYRQNHKEIDSVVALNR